MPLCSRRAWTTFQGPVDPSRLTTYPHPVATTTASRPATFSIRYPHRKDGGCLSSRPSTHSGRRCSTCTSFIPAKPKLASHFYPGTHNFLGFHCRKLESWKYRGYRYLQRWPGRRALQRIRDKIKAITAPRHRLPEPVSTIVAEVNQALRHWGAYFRVGNSGRKFAQVDDYVRERLALFLSKKSGRHGRHFERYTYAYFKRLGVYRLVGT